MKLEDLLKNQNTAFLAGFIAMGIFYGLYFITIRYGPKLYNYLFRDEQPYLQNGKYEKRLKAKIDAYEFLNKERLDKAKKEIERKYPQFLSK